MPLVLQMQEGEGQQTTVIGLSVFLQGFGMLTYIVYAHAPANKANPPKGFQDERGMFDKRRDPESPETLSMNGRPRRSGLLFEQRAKS
ncbi:hypothetical protein BT96DRAFT_1007048 [Gymnopus androsaceus JB14]|uniref:Uncharacterized protein n=1 Tax=Gymnopus androsaceus JB14 TaxID=1447944 RepID=A0A6A4GJE7_9AGAR|nr:hypothetical protein BT96DRAFT_1007048 [Gymnopus androsaceus JB14]